MIRPPSLCSRCGSAEPTSRTAGVSSELERLLERVRRRPRSPVPARRAARVPHEDVEPAERLERRSRRRARGLAGGVTSPRTASAPIRSASRSSTSRLRANIVTFAPSAASASALARPSPDEAPQTSAVRPFSPRSTRAAYLRRQPSGRQHADDLADGVGRLPAAPACSSSERSSSTICSIPFGPSFTGTPM